MTTEIEAIISRAEQLRSWAEQKTSAPALATRENLAAVLELIIRLSQQVQDMRACEPSSPQSDTRSADRPPRSGR
jgi:hypothetical protein